MLQRSDTPEDITDLESRRAIAAGERFDKRVGGVRGLHVHLLGGTWFVVWGQDVALSGRGSSLHAALFDLRITLELAIERGGHPGFARTRATPAEGEKPR